MQNPVRGILHGTAALVSLVGLVALATRALDDPSRFWSLLVFGGALVAMYTTSSLYHSVPWSPGWKSWLQRVDHILIYALFAATFTPLAVAMLDGVWLAVALSLAWGLAALGAAKELWPRMRNRATLAVQMAVGALALIPLWDLLTRMAPMPAALIVGGGVLYLAGVLMLVNGWPRLFPRVFSTHEVFHIMVVLASIAHFVAVLQVTAPVR
jgi:hemolysin III